MGSSADFDGTIEVVRGELDDERAGQLLDFWTSRGALTEEQARMRLAEVVCVALDPEGEIAGVNSVFPERVHLVGERLFWVYRSALLDATADVAMLNAAFEALESAFDAEAGGPIGLCLLVGDRETTRRRPELIWPETGMLYAGQGEDGTQVRIRYFDGVAIGPGLPISPSLADQRTADRTLEPGYRLVEFADASEVTPDDVVDVWLREHVIDEEEARRRVEEVHLVALDEGGHVVGISSAYLQLQPQLGMEMWHYRAFVVKAHRMSTLAVNLAVRGREVLEERYVSGEDTRAPGIVYEIENEGLKKYFNRALWWPTDFTFIGENQRGDHVRVHYFAGAELP